MGAKEQEWKKRRQMGNLLTGKGCEWLEDRLEDIEGDQFSIATPLPHCSIHPPAELHKTRSVMRVSPSSCRSGKISQAKVISIWRQFGSIWKVPTPKINGTKRLRGLYFSPKCKAVGRCARSSMNWSKRDNIEGQSLWWDDVIHTVRILFCFFLVVSQV